MAKVKVDPDVQKLIDEYNSAYNILCRSGEFLYGARLSAAKTIANVEDLVNSIANHPNTQARQILQGQKRPSLYPA